MDILDGSHRATLLIVDDNPENLAVLGELLLPFYQVRAANNGHRALEIAATEPLPDLILLDVMMPDMDGYEVLAQLRRDARGQGIPVIFVTALDAEDCEERGLDMGAVDYITKPLRPPIVLARVRSHLELKRARDWLQDQKFFLEQEVNRRMEDNLLIQDVSIHALARLAETRDPETGNHIRRTQESVFLPLPCNCIPVFPSVAATARWTCWPAPPLCMISARWAFRTTSFSSPASSVRRSGR